MNFISQPFIICLIRTTEILLKVTITTYLKIQSSGFFTDTLYMLYNTDTETNSKLAKKIAKNC